MLHQSKINKYKMKTAADPGFEAKKFVTSLPLPRFFSSSPQSPFPSLPSPSFPSPVPSHPRVPFLPPLPLPPIPSPPRRVALIFPARGQGSTVSSTSGVHGGAPAAKTSLAYLEPRKRVWSFWWQGFRSFSCGTKCLRRSLYYAVFHACYGYEICPAEDGYAEFLHLPKPTGHT